MRAIKKRFGLICCLMLVVGCFNSNDLDSNSNGRNEELEELAGDVLDIEVVFTDKGFDFELFAYLIVRNPLEEEVTFVSAIGLADEIRSYFEAYGQPISARAEMTVPGSFMDIGSAQEATILSYEYYIGDRYFVIDREQNMEQEYHIVFNPDSDVNIIYVSYKNSNTTRDISNYVFTLNGDTKQYLFGELKAILQFYRNETAFVMKEVDQSVTNDEINLINNTLKENFIYHVETRNQPFEGACGNC